MIRRSPAGRRGHRLLGFGPAPPVTPGAGTNPWWRRWFCGSRRARWRGRRAPRSPALGWWWRCRSTDWAPGAGPGRPPRAGPWRWWRPRAASGNWRHWSCWELQPETQGNQVSKTQLQSLKRVHAPSWGTHPHTWWRWPSCHTWPAGRRAAGWSSGPGSSWVLGFVCHGKLRCRRRQGSSARPGTSPPPVGGQRERERPPRWCLPRIITPATTVRTTPEGGGHSFTFTLHLEKRVREFVFGVVVATLGWKHVGPPVGQKDTITARLQD